MWWLFMCRFNPCFCFRPFPHNSHLNFGEAWTAAWFVRDCWEDTFRPQYLHWNTVLQSCLLKLSKLCVLNGQSWQDMGETFSCSMRTWAKTESLLERSWSQTTHLYRLRPCFWVNSTRFPPTTATPRTWCWRSGPPASNSLLFSEFSLSVRKSVVGSLFELS